MLDEQDLLKIQEMIVGVVKELQKPIKPAKMPKKRKYTKRKVASSKIAKKLDKPEESGTIEEEPEVVPQRRVRRIKSENTERKKAGDKGKQARTEPFRPIKNRPNNFLKSPDAKLFTKDTRIDKKLSGNLELTPRRTSANLVEAECISCGDVYEVSTKEIMRDAETGEARWKCNNCIRR